MSNEWLKEAGFETLAIREGLNPGFEQEHSDPIYATSALFSNRLSRPRRFSGERDGNTYSRFSNPTVSVFEKRLAALEGARGCSYQLRYGRDSDALPDRATGGRSCNLLTQRIRKYCRFI